jgi:hypothetical protein
VATRERQELHATGTRGQLRWHHYPVADLCGFTVHRDKQLRWTVTAQLVHADAFKLAQSPLTLYVPSRFGAWHWTITAVRSRESHAFVADLDGPPRRDRTDTVTKPQPPASPTVYDAFGQAYRRYQQPY